MGFLNWPRGSVVVKALCYNRKVAGSIPDEVIFYLILPAALGPGVYSASNRNEYNVGSLTSHNLIGLQGLLRG
jgi:hypothetical protein